MRKSLEKNEIGREEKGEKEIRFFPYDIHSDKFIYKEV